MREFDLIRQLQEQVGASGPECALGIGDDAAVLDCPPDRQLVVCTDTLVEGIHFPSGTSPESIGHKALAVNLSDLAAMGAEPGWFLLALTLPESDTEWLERFTCGLSRLALEAGIRLAGGDTTSGPLSVTITAIGKVEPGQAMSRAGARAGDLVVVSGTPGRAACALKSLQSGQQPKTECREALDFPSPRLELGRQLRGQATACIDVSDGLLADLGHILDQSRLGARIDIADLPPLLESDDQDEEGAWRLQLSGGDDYELCFTLPAARRDRLEEVARQSGVTLSVIGEVLATPGLQVVRPDGKPFETARVGWEHFSSRGDQDLAS